MNPNRGLPHPAAHTAPIAFLGSTYTHPLPTHDFTTQNFENLAVLQQQPEAKTESGGGELTLLRDEVRTASRVFPFLSLVRVPEYREPDKEPTDIAGRDGLLDLVV